MAGPAGRQRRRRGGRDRTGVYSAIRQIRPIGSPPVAAGPGARGTVAGMPIPRRYTTDAIVLSRFDLGEADRVLTLITPTGGKLKAIAKGVRKPTSRLGGSLEPFAELTVGLARGRTFDVVTEVRVGTPGSSCATRSIGGHGLVLAELADRSLEERHAAEPQYLLLRRAYQLLDAAMAPGRVRAAYDMHLLDELGQRPEVDRCVECDRVLDADERFRWGRRSAASTCLSHSTFDAFVRKPGAQLA